jgi:hypothetical protein
MLTAVQSLRLSAGKVAGQLWEGNVSMTGQGDESRTSPQSTKPPGFGLLRESQLSRFRQFKLAGSDEIPRSALRESGDAHRSPKPSALCWENGWAALGGKRADDWAGRRIQDQSSKHEAARLWTAAPVLICKTV